MANEKVVKIYDLQELGGENLISTLDQINKQFSDLRKTKIALNQQSLKDSISGETDASKKLLEQLQALTVKELELKVERQDLINQSKQLQLVRQQEINQNKLEASGATAVAGSYNDVSKSLKTLNLDIKNKFSLGDTSDELKSKLDEAKALKKQLNDFNRNQSPDGTLVGEYKTGILNAFKDAGLTDLINNQLTQSKARVAELDAQFELLKQELNSVKTTGQGSLDALERQLIENRTAAGELTGQIASVEKELRGTGVGTQIIDGLKENFKDLGKQIAQTLIAYISFQAAFEGIRTGIETAKELSDQTTNLEIELDKTAGGADKLVSNLAKLNTRTKLTDLEDIANIAAKAGVSEDNLVGVAQSIDKIKIAFGKDFGDVEKGTEDLVKLVNVFLGTDQVTGDNLLKTGNAVRTLANESVASVPFLNDFSKRMAGLKGVSDITLPSVLGLASGFEQFGQSAEVSSTALVRIIPKLASDTEKYGQIAGLTSVEFSKLLNSHPEEALIKVSEGLVKGKTSIEDISEAFADSDLGKGRITSVLGVLGKNADTFRKSIETAGTAFNNTTNIEDAFNAKNENLAATIDKVSKKFADAANNKAFQFSILAISTVISGLIGIMPVLITLLSAYGVVWLVANSAMIKANATTLLSNIAFKAQYAWLVITNTLLQAKTVILNAYAERQNIATAAANLFNITLKENPLAAVVAVLGILIATFEIFEAILGGSTAKVKEHAEALNFQNEAARIASQNTADQVNKLNILVEVAKNVKNSDDTRKQSIKELIALYPQFSKALNGEIISIKGLNDAYLQVTKSIRLMAEAQASGQLSAEKEKSILQVTALRQKIEVESQGKQGSVYLNGLSQDDQNILQAGNSSSFNTSVRGSGDGKAIFLAQDRDAIVQYLKSVEDQRTKSYEQYVTFAAKKQAELNAFEKANQDATQKAIEGSNSVTVGQRRDYLKEEIQKLSDDYDTILDTDSAAQQKNIALRQKYQAELDSINTKKNGKPAKEKAYDGAKLSGDTKDDLKDQSALTETEIAKLKENFGKGEILEADYYTQLNKITQAGIDKKLAIIKGGNAEEKKQIADLKLAKVDSTKDMNQKLYELGEKDAKQTLDSAKSNAENQLKLVTDNANSTELEKAQAQLKYDQDALDAQIKFNDTMDTVEKNYGAKSVENARKRGDDLTQDQRKILSDQLAVARAAAAEKERIANDVVSINTSNEDADYASKQEAIYQKTYATKAQQNRALEELEREHQANLLGIQLAGLYDAYIANDASVKDETKTYDEYEKKRAEINAAIAKNQADTAKLGLESTEAAKQQTIKTIDSIVQALQKVQAVTSAYADLQNEKIQNEQDATDAQIEADRTKALSTATTQADQQAVNDKYDKLKAANDKKYAEERRKVALSELEIQSALAALIAFKDGLENGGPWIGAAYVALVGVQYLLNRKKIMAQKFADGGELSKSLNLSRTMTNGGKFDGPSHAFGGIRFSFGQKPVEVEGKEGYVINKNSMTSGQQMTVSGTPSQIASAANVAGGGVDFAPGAYKSRFMFDYGGSLGMNLQAPIMPPRYNPAPFSGDNGASEILDTMRAQASAIVAMSNQILTLQVQLNPNQVTNYQDKRKKAVAIATL